MEMMNLIIQRIEDHKDFQPYYLYCQDYAILDVKDKIVVDIGADWGTSPYFFLRQGAKKVIAFEANMEYVDFMRDVFKDYPVEVHPVWDGIEGKGDVLKIDCDGCENVLTESYLKQFKQFSVAIHPRAVGEEHYKRLLKLMNDYGGKFLKRIEDNHNPEEMYQKL